MFPDRTSPRFPRRRTGTLNSTALIVVAALFACNGGPTGSVPCSNPSITVNSDSLILLQSYDQQLSAQAYCGTAPTTTTLLFSTSDTTTATVSAQGLVSAHRGGRTTVSISALGVVRDVPIIVFGHPAGILAQTQTLTGSPVGVAVSPSGIVLVTRYDSTSLGRFALPALAGIPGPSVPSTGLDVAFDGTGAAAFVTNRDQQLVTSVDVLANVSNGATPVGGHPLRIIFHPATNTVFVTTDQDSLYEIDVATRAVLSKIFLPSGVTSSGPNGLAFSPDRDILYVSRQSGGVLKISVASLAILDTIPVGSAEGLAISPSGDTLYDAGASPVGLYIWNQVTHAFLTYLSLPAAPYDVKLTPDSTRIYVTAQSDLFVLDRGTLQFTDTLHLATSTGPLRRVAFDRYGRFATVADESGAVYLIR
jgi:DNA-binding beta-propeller fold protein YncE